MSPVDVPAPPRPRLAGSLPTALPTALLRALLRALLVGLAVGAVTSPAQTLLGGTVASGLANAVSPWLLAPFLVGARARSNRAAAAVGVLACVAQVAGYYAVSAARGFGVHPGTVAEWVVAGVVGGAVLGVASRSWQVAEGRWRGLGAALLVAAWLAEGVFFQVVLGYSGSAVLSVLVGAALLVVLGSHRQQHGPVLRWLAPALAAGGLGFAVLLAVL